MRASWYAQALYEVLQSQKGDDDKIITQFTRTVHANGDAHLFSKIISSFREIIEKEKKSGTISVITAEPVSEEHVIALLKKEPFKNALSSRHKRVERKTDRTIVGGVIVQTGTTRIDASYKRMLIDLYGGMTAHL